MRYQLDQITASVDIRGCLFGDKLSVSRACRLPNHDGTQPTERVKGTEEELNTCVRAHR